MSVDLIAEVGSVHDGSFGNATKLIELAAACGATTVKFQTHIAEAETLPNAPMPPYFKGEPRFEYFKRTGFSREQWHALKSKADECGIAFLSSPFSLEAVDLLEEVGVGAYKVPSGEVSNLPLLERLAATGKQVILSSGMSDWQELDTAVAILKRGGPVCILQCSSVYPCPPEKVGLNLIGEFRDRYGISVGFSDHTMSNTAAITAAAFGAEVIEKHLTFSRAMYGSDAANAAEPTQFKALAVALTELSAMLANPVEKNELAPYRNMKRIFEKSIVAARDLTSGAVLSIDDLAFKKPGDGISAARYREIVGRKLARPVSRDQMLREDDLAANPEPPHER